MNIRKKVHQFGIYDLDGNSVNDVIQVLELLKNKHGDDLSLEVDTEFRAYEDQPTTVIKVYLTRPETEHEARERIHREQAAAERRERLAEERAMLSGNREALYRKLQQEFGNENE